MNATSELSSSIEAAVISLISRDSQAFVESLRHIARAETNEVYAGLFGLISHLAESWRDREVPSVDALGNSGVEELVASIRDRDSQRFRACAGDDFGEIVTRLLATAAVLKLSPDVSRVPADHR